MNRREAHNWYNRVIDACKSQGELIAAMAKLGREDLFYLLVYLLKREDADNDFVYARCREVQAEPDLHLDLWSREHYKSTVITFALTIQDIINDPEVTVGIFSFTRPIAKQFLRQIKRELESNETLKLLYPEVLWEKPAKQAPKWNEDDGIVVRRKGNPKEATVEAHGLVDGQPTSKHYSLVVYDDVVSRESVTTPEQIAKTTNGWELSLNLHARGGRSRYIGTRWHYSDTYKTILERQVVTPRIYTPTVDGTLEGEPVLLTREELADKWRAMGPYVAAAQLFQNPAMDDAQGFREEWLRYWPGMVAINMNVYILVELAAV